MISLRAVGGISQSSALATSCKSTYRPSSKLLCQHQRYLLSHTTKFLSLSGVYEDAERELHKSDARSHASPQPAEFYYASVLSKSTQTFVRLRLSTHPDCVLSRIGVRFPQYSISQISSPASPLSHGTLRHTGFDRKPRLREGIHSSCVRTTLPPRDYWWPGRCVGRCCGPNSDNPQK